MRKLLIVIALVLLVLPVTAWSIESTTNFGFEGTYVAGVAPGWAQVPGYAGICSEENTILKSGTASQKADSNVPVSGDAVVYAAFAVESGHNYTVKVWRSEAIGWNGYLGVAADGVLPAAPSSICVINSGASGWSQLSWTGTATANQLIVILEAYPGIVYFDDVTITENVPPPPDTGTPPQKIYSEQVYWEANHGAPAGNAMGHGQVLIDGNKSIIAEGQGGLLLYADEQTNGTAFVKSTSFWGYDSGNYATKGGTMLNGRLYSQDGLRGIHQGTLPNFAGGLGTAPDGPWGPAMPTGRVESDSYGLVTDGTYLYGSDNPGAFAVGPAHIYKWSVNPAGNGGSGVLTQVWDVTIPTATWLVSIGYYGGKLYAAEGFRGTNIYEIDCATGAYQTILSGANLIPSTVGTDVWYMGQIARCGNRLVLAGWAGYITQWQLIGGTWTLVGNNGGLSTNTGSPYFMGISLMPGPDGNAKYAWLSGSDTVQFFDLTPATSAGKSSASFWKNGYTVWANDLVVTAQGPTGTGFWVENTDRTLSAFVPTAETATVGNLVTIKGIISKSASGERILTPSEAIIVGAVANPTVKPLYMTNKTMGPATGSSGLANDGLLVTISGKVTGTDMNTEPPTFYIDDGSGVATAIGVKVLKADGTQIAAPYFNDVDGIFVSPNPGNFYAVVTGIVRLEGSGNAVTRRIDARSDADVVITVLP